MESLKGHFLIATPGLMDPNFHRTVVLLVEHSGEGAMGLVLNRPTSTPLGEVWEQVGDGACALDGTLFKGGPCEGPLMVIHGSRDASQVDVCDGVYFCAESERVTSVVEGGREPARVFVGYAGWGAGQLENELNQGGWLTLAASDAMVFADPDEQWKAVMHTASRQRIDVRIFPDDPTVN